MSDSLSSNRARQPKGIPVGGQYATSARSESGVSLGGVDGDTGGAEPKVDYSTWTPPEVDETLATLYAQHGTAMSRWSSTVSHVNGEIARHAFNRGFRGSCTRQEMVDWIDQAQARAAEAEAAGQGPDYWDAQILRHWDTAEEYLAEAEGAAAKMVPLNEEFQRRGGWSRAFLVANANGHVHSSMDCSTCYQPGIKPDGTWREGTRYHWVTEYSGSTEKEIVEAAASRCCTVCFPSAPTDLLDRPTSMFTPEEKDKAAAKVEREKARAEREAKKIANGLTSDGSEFKVTWTEVRGGSDYVGGQHVYSVKPRPGRESFKTERAATQWLVQDLAWNRDRAQALAERQPAYDAVIEAIATKHDRTVEDVCAEIDKKVAQKRKRDGYPD